MFNAITAKFYEKFIYRLPSEVMPQWLQEPYTTEQSKIMLGMLKTVVQAEQKLPLTKDSVESNFLSKIAKYIFKSKSTANTIEAKPIQKYLLKCSQAHRSDFLLLSIILSLSTEKHLPERIAILLKYKAYLSANKRVWKILEAVKEGDKAKIKKPYVLGEAFQNQIARVNGIKHFGLMDYKAQMHMMQKGTTHEDTLHRYQFLRKVPKTTMGGALRELLLKQKLTLPGNGYGFPEFFFWHDLSHLLSGNNTKFDGEVCTNIFTAAYSKRGKYNILLFGLLQFNLGYNLAVVAKPSKELFKESKTIDFYLKSLLSGVGSKLDLLDYCPDTMHADLKEPLFSVRRKYGVVSVQND